MAIEIKNKSIFMQRICLPANFVYAFRLMQFLQFGSALLLSEPLNFICILISGIIYADDSI